jgi:hypothetical protein
VGEVSKCLKRKLLTSLGSAVMDWKDCPELQGEATVGSRVPLWEAGHPMLKRPLQKQFVQSTCNIGNIEFLAQILFLINT